MLRRLRRAWLQHVLFGAKVPYDLWHQSVSLAPVLMSLDHQEKHRLRKLTSLFLREKTISGAGGLVVDAPMRVYIAAQACLLILNLDLDYFDGWQEIIVYPDSFLVRRQERDASGVVHDTSRALAGESWSRGPVILSWSNMQPGVRPHGLSSNVILHEFAHKIDSLNGPADGLPPLHRGMIIKDWTAAFSAAYEHLNSELDKGRDTAVDPYGATKPAEFFAVITEMFFEQPALLLDVYPAVHRQMVLFYKQDPYARTSR